MPPHDASVILLRFFFESSSFLVSFSRIGVEVLPPKKLRISAGMMEIFDGILSLTLKELPKIYRWDWVNIVVQRWIPGRVSESQTLMMYATP